MNAEEFLHALHADFFTGVPDSILKPFVGAVMARYGTDPRHHVIAANEGNAAAVAAGHYLATGGVPVVYLQNSGEGNLVNPAVSLLHRNVYGIPALFVIGWRGKPGTMDEPQHMEQGKITLQLLDLLDIPYTVMGKTTTVEEIQGAMEAFRTSFAQGSGAAIIVSKDALTSSGIANHRNGYCLRREEILRQLLDIAGDDFIVATTGKASRELFELREARGEDHAHDFLTVGSMGHASSIALGVALARPSRRIWCIDGDGAAIMHLGSMAVIGKAHPSNLVHVVIDNEAHESVGGFPTAAGTMDFAAIARGCGYAQAAEAHTLEGIKGCLGTMLCADGPSFLVIKSMIGARADLGRPTRSPHETKKDFMDALRTADQFGGRRKDRRGFQ